MTVTTPTVTASYTYATTAGTTGREVILTLTDSSTSNLPTANPISARSWTLTYPATSTITSSLAEVTLTIGTNVTEVGSYSLVLTATGLLGQTDSCTNTELVWVNYLTPTVTFTATPLVVDASQTVSYYNNVTGDYSTVTWAFGDTSTSTSTATTLTHSYATQGTYNIVMTVVASTTGTATTTSSASRTGYVTVIGTNYQRTLGGMLRELQWHLLEDPDVLPCSAFTNFGGLDNVLLHYYRRLHEFLKLTQLTSTETTLAAATAGVYPLPADCISLIRVEADGYALQPLDKKQADLWEAGWETGTATAYGYIMEPEDALTLRLVPLATTATTVKVIYVKAADVASTPADCLSWGTIPVPRAFDWVLKWGVLADLLSQEGELNDPVRAKFAEEIYQMGVALAKKLFLGGVENL